MNSAIVGKIHWKDLLYEFFILNPQFMTHCLVIIQSYNIHNAGHSATRPYLQPFAFYSLYPFSFPFFSIVFIFYLCLILRKIIIKIYFTHGHILWGFWQKHPIVPIGLLEKLVIINDCHTKKVLKSSQTHEGPILWLLQFTAVMDRFHYGCKLRTTCIQNIL